MTTDITTLNAAAGTIPARQLGLSSGELLDLVGREVTRIMRESDGSRLKAAKVLLKRLRDANQITEKDEDRLKDVCDLIFLAENGRRPHDQVARELRDIHAKILLDPESSSLAGTMIGVVYATQQETTIATAGLIGGLFGAVIGFAVSGGQASGAGIGWGVGLVVGAYVGAVCSEE